MKDIVLMRYLKNMEEIKLVLDPEFAKYLGDKILFNLIKYLSKDLPVENKSIVVSILDTYSNLIKEK
ncbi:MAG: hypothetical protein Q4A42_02880 [Tissierellia bacterium]|nr:hypothetical protein [Tissierellia bacterium]